MITYYFSIDHDDPERFHEVRCPHCRALLNIHLPDPELPYRLLGTCGTCRSWYVIDCNLMRMAQVAPEPLPFAGA